MGRGMTLRWREGKGEVLRAADNLGTHQGYFFYTLISRPRTVEKLFRALEDYKKKRTNI